MPGDLRQEGPLRTVTRGALSGLLTALLLSVSACGGDEKPAAAAAQATPRPADQHASRTVAVALESEGGSRPSGRATLREHGGQLTVTLQVKPRLVGYRAHIHNVTCAEYREMRGFAAQLATVSTSLEDVVEGTSVTAIHGPASDVLSAGRAINIHELEPPYEVVACGDIPRR